MLYVPENMTGETFAAQIDYEGESDIDGDSNDEHEHVDDEDDIDMDPEEPVSLNDCIKSLATVRDFFQCHGSDEPVFNAVKHLEKVSLALSIQAASQNNRFLQKMNVKLSSQENDVSSNTENSHLPFIIYNKLVRLGKTQNKRNSRFKRQYAADELFS